MPERSKTGPSAAPLPWFGRDVVSNAKTHLFICRAVKLLVAKQMKFLPDHLGPIQKQFAVWEASRIHGRTDLRLCSNVYEVPINTPCSSLKCLGGGVKEAFSGFSQFALHTEWVLGQVPGLWLRRVCGCSGNVDLGWGVKATELWDQKHYVSERWVSSVC